MGCFGLTNNQINKSTFFLPQIIVESFEI